MNPLALLCAFIGFIGVMNDIPFAVWLMLYGIFTSTSSPNSGD
jgi:hypothetical protein